MSSETKKESQLEIAHVLFIDIVGYSKLSINEQRAAIDELTQVVRASEQFQNAEAGARLIKIPIGDGMALVFYKTPEEPVKCALEISRGLKEHPRLQLRMGVYSGPVSGVIEEALKIIRQLLTIPVGEQIYVTLLKIDPVWDPVRDDPGFQKLLSEPKPETITSSLL